MWLLHDSYLSFGVMQEWCHSFIYQTCDWSIPSSNTLTERETLTVTERETHTMTERHTVTERERHTQWQRQTHTHCDRERCTWLRQRKMHVTGIERHAYDISRHMSCLYVNDSHMWVIRIWMRVIHMGDMIHSYMWHEHVTWLFFSKGSWHDMSLYVWHDSFVCVTWPIYMCNMTHLYVWHDSFVCVTWAIHMCDTTHLYV